MAQHTITGAAKVSRVVISLDQARYRPLQMTLTTTSGKKQSNISPLEIEKLSSYRYVT